MAVRPAPRPRLFGTAGIRGRTNFDVSPELVLKMSAVYAARLAGRGSAGRPPRLILGRDTRHGAGMLADAAAAGAMSAGASVDDAGVIPTGGICTLLTRGRYDGGLLITGSHTPPDRIGFIALTRDGAYLSDSEAVAIEAAYDRFDRDSIAVEPERVGRRKELKDPLVDYRGDLIRRVDTAAIRKARFRLFADPVNGTATMVLADLMRSLGVRLDGINLGPSPAFGRESEPRARNLGPAARGTVRTRSHLGVGFDVDADRILFITQRGAILSEDLIGALFAWYVVAGRSLAALKAAVRTPPSPARGRRLTFVQPINSSGLIEWVARRLGARIIDCAPGQPSTVEQVLRHRADYAYEESGKYYFTREALWCDGLLALVKLLELMAKTGDSLEALAAPFPRFTQVKNLVHCDDHVKPRVMDRVWSALRREDPGQKAKDVTVSGLKRVYRDGAWLLLRASGTEPLIRVYADAPSAERAQELAQWGLDLVHRAMH